MNDDVSEINKREKTYGDLFEVAKSQYINKLVQENKSDEIIKKRTQELTWGFNKFCEIADIITPAEIIDERVMTKVTMERIINNKLKAAATRKQVMTVMRAHVRPIALQISEENENFQSLAKLLNFHISQKNIKPKRLALDIGMDPSTLRHWMQRGGLPTTRKNLEHLGAIERFLGLPPKTLLAYANGPRATHLLIDEPARSHLSLSEALTHYMALGKYNTQQLSAKVNVCQTNMNDWIRKGNVPRNSKNIEALQECERILNTPPGALMQFTDRSRRYLEALHTDYGISANKFKTIRKHFPDNFDQLSPQKRQEIVDWAVENMRVPLDEDDDGGERSPYRCQFRGVSYHAGFHDGVFFAPPQLQREYDALIHMHTSVPVPIGIERRNKWTDGAIDARTSFLGMFFGAVRQVEPDLPSSHYSMLLAADINLVRKAIDCLIERRGMATPSIGFILTNLQRLFSVDRGFIVQHRDLFSELYSSIPRGEQYKEFCQKTADDLSIERRRRRDQIRTGRYSFRSLNVVLRKDRPLDEYFKIIDYIDQCTPLVYQQPFEWARNKRDSFLIHFLMLMPLRLKNCTNLILQEESKEPPTFEQLAIKEMALLYRRGSEWRVKIPKASFKNRSSPATSNVDVALLNWAGLYERLEDYLEARRILNNGRPDYGQLFVKDMSQPMSNPNELLSAQVLSNIFLNAITKYGIYNPFTKTGAIEGLRPHRIHAMRHIVATHLSKIRNYDTAAARLFDSVEMIIKTYADYQPSEKFQASDQGYDSDPRRIGSVALNRPLRGTRTE